MAAWAAQNAPVVLLITGLLFSLVVLLMKRELGRIEEHMRKEEKLWAKVDELKEQVDTLGGKVESLENMLTAVLERRSYPRV